MNAHFKVSLDHHHHHCGGLVGAWLLSKGRAPAPSMLVTGSTSTLAEYLDCRHPRVLGYRIPDASPGNHGDSNLLTR